MQRRQKTFSAIFLALAMLFSYSCNTSNAVKGGAIGAVAGGVAGGLIAKKTAVGVVIGAAVGGTAGALIGRHMDKQAEELRRDMKGAKVERVGEGILITFDSGLLFDVNSSELKPATKSNLVELSKTLNKYEDTDILIEGHTDSTGSDEHNRGLSVRRANSVSAYLMRRGVVASRFTAVGYGESQPVASNETLSGRRQNRRVELAIYANKKMQKAAKRGEL